MKYNQAGIAFMPKAPKTAEATAITILRSLSHQFDFVAIRFKLRVRLKKHTSGGHTDSLHCLLTVKTGHGLSERVLLFTAATTAVATGRTAVRRLVQRERHICRTAGGSRTAVHKLQLLVGHKADIHFGDIPHRAVFRLLHTRTAKRHVKRAELVQLHLVAVGKVALNLLHQGFDDVLHVALRHGTVFLNGGGKDIDVHGAAGLGFLTEIVQHGRSRVAYDFTALEALYNYIHKFEKLRFKLRKMSYKREVGKGRDRAPESMIIPFLKHITKIQH